MNERDVIKLRKGISGASVGTVRNYGSASLPCVLSAYTATYVSSVNYSTCLDYGTVCPTSYDALVNEAAVRHSPSAVDTLVRMNNEVPKHVNLPPELEDAILRGMKYEAISGGFTE